jgi:hypothetical protein
MQDMGEGVVAGGLGAVLPVYRGLDLRPAPQDALLNRPEMCDVSIVDAAGVRDAEQAILRPDHALIANLTAALGVERRLVQHDEPFLPLPKLTGGLTAVAQCKYRTGTVKSIEPDEDRGRHVANLVGLALGDTGEARGCPATAPLRLHRGVEAGPVSSQTGLLHDLLGKLVGKAEGVVKLEQQPTLNLALAGLLRLGDPLTQALGAGCQRLGEAGLLQHDRLDDGVAALA